MGVPQDDVFAVLSHEHRRLVVHELTFGPRTVDGLARAIADATDMETVDDAMVALHHVHVPKLEQAGLVTVEDGIVTGTVSDTRHAQPGTTRHV